MELDAKKYNKTNKLQIRDADELIQLIHENGDDKKYEIILDIGCGSGNITKLISDTFDAQVYGVDVDPAMIKFAEENHPNDKITYILQDFGHNWQQLSPEVQSLAGRVSLIFSNHCLHWIHNKDNAVANMKRLLRPIGGKIYANILYIPDYYNDLNPEEKAVLEKEFMRVPTREEQRAVWMELFDKHGFRVIHEKYLSKDTVFERKFIEKDAIQMALTVRRQYFSKDKIDDLDNKAKDLYRRFIEDCKLFVDETTGKNMIEEKYEYFQFVVEC